MSSGSGILKPLRLSAEAGRSKAGNRPSRQNTEKRHIGIERLDPASTQWLDVDELLARMRLEGSSWAGTAGLGQQL